FSSRRRHTRWPRDWSSDVCSSDLADPPAVLPFESSSQCRIEVSQIGAFANPHSVGRIGDDPAFLTHICNIRELGERLGYGRSRKIGRASCRERVWMVVVGGSLKRK